MGKASSSKKVARAARAGGSARSTDRRKLGFPIAVAAVVIGGVLLVFIAQNMSDEEAVAPTLSDHWHSAYGVYICNEFLPPLNDVGADALGIHTHGDGLIHIHPHSANAAGENATFGVFADQVGLVVEDGSFTTPSGQTYTDGDDCDGEAGTVRLVRWETAEADPVEVAAGIRGAKFDANGEAFVLAFAPAGAEIPLPESIGVEPSDVEPTGAEPTVPATAGTADTTETNPDADTTGQ